MAFWQMIKDTSVVDLYINLQAAMSQASWASQQNQEKEK